MSIHRNAPCPCGSGKKYKKCCMSKTKIQQFEPIFEVLLKKIKEHQKEEIRRAEKYGKVRPIIHCDHQGYKCVAVGNRLYYSMNWVTFPDFLKDYIVSVLGKSWFSSESKKNPDEKHQISEWYEATCRFQKTQVKGKDGLFVAKPSGPMAAYLSLAYDLYVLNHHKAISEIVVQRLKQKDQFQGARYELFATATCLRAGFDIHFENEKDGSRKHSEFIASHKITSERISVEAKSKHREGILGYPGSKKADDEIRLMVGGLINQAIKKETNQPIVIFIDVNIPPAFAEKLMGIPPKGIIRALDQVKKAPDGKDLFNLIIFTNIPHHYGGDYDPDPKKHIVSVFSGKPKNKTNHRQTLFDLNNAALQYGVIPNEFPEN
jgi:SEC-C motif